MKLIVATLSANYNGRGLTELPPAKRLLMLKDDGTVLIMNDKGFKPINYMTTINEFNQEHKDGETHLLFSNKKEKLEIILHEIFQESEIELDLNDPSIIREQTEEKLQLYISKNLSKIDEKYEFLSREFETGFGPVDILAKNKETGGMVAIEIKRTATINSVYQVLRYVDSLESRYETVEPVLIALNFNDSTKRLASNKGVTCLTVPSDWSEEEFEEFTLF